MSYARLRSDILLARDAREALIAAQCAPAPDRPPGGALVFAALNLPGPDKSPPGAERLFDQALASLRARFADLELRRRQRDQLGPFALLAISNPAARAVKRQTVALEQEWPWARLLDLDVYGSDGSRVGRSELGLGARRCFLCPRPVHDCIRLGRHPHEELVAHAHALLRQFAAR